MKNLFAGIGSDARLGLRRLARNPGFTVVAVVTLTLSIGMSTAAYSVLNTLLFRSSSMLDEERLVNVYGTSGGAESAGHVAREFLAYEEQNTVFTSMFAFANRLVNFEQRDGTAASLVGMQVTGGAFETLDVVPSIGRLLSEEDAVPGAPAVAVLSHPFWREQLGGDPDVLGRAVEINGVTIEIVGVLPPGLLTQFDIWQPLSLQSAAAQRNAGNGYLRIVAKLRDGVTVQQAEAEMETLAPRIRQELLGGEQSNGISLATLRESDADSRRTVFFILVVSGLVLLIACINLMNLQLARMTATIREFGMRSTLGASPLRLIRLSLTESLILALVGGCLAILAAQLGIVLINDRLLSSAVEQQVVADFRVLGFALLLTLFAGLFFGSIPAWLASRPGRAMSKSAGTRLSSQGRSHRLLHRSLIVGQLTLALVVLAAGATLTQTLLRAMQFKPGWDVDGIVTASLVLDSPRYQSAEARHAFFNEFEQNLIGMPEFENAAFALSLPVGPLSTSGMELFTDDRPVSSRAEDAIRVYFGGVTANYFDTLGMTLVAGRDFRTTDDQNRPNVIVINQAVAEIMWPGESAIGKRISAGSPPDNPMWREVIGVVNDVGYPARPLGSYSPYQIYGPLYQYSQFAIDGVAIAARTSGNPDVAASAFHRALSVVDPSLAARNVRPATAIVDDGLSRYVEMTTVLGVFSFVGLAIAVVGVYGVMSYAVAQRRRELGIRIALGAQRLNIKALILRQGIALIALAMVLGLAGVQAVHRMLNAMLPEIQPSPATTAIVIALLGSVALIAIYLPARRAASVPPVQALRSE